MKKNIYCFIGLIIILSFYRIDAQVFDPTTIPEKYGSTNYGTDFWLTFHPNYQSVQADNSIRIYITSAVETTVKLEVAGRGYQETLTTIPNKTMQFDVSITVGQPFTGGMSIAPPIEQVYDRVGIHITSLDPIAVYGLAIGSGSSDGYMAIPVSTWGKEYIIASWADVSNNLTDFKPSYVSIIGAYDNTRVSFVLGGNNSTQTKGGMYPGELKQFTLYSGDVLVFPSMGINADLSGSRIFANKPIGVVTGNRSATIPETENDFNYIIEMELPTNVWGKEFHVAPINKRKKNPIIKIFAKEEGTKIYKNGAEIATIKYKGGLENDAWLRMRTDNGNPAPVTFRSDKPIGITLYNTSVSEDTGSIAPFQMVQIPIEQYQKEVLFTTPSTVNYVQFSTNFINIIYESNDSGTVPDDLEFEHEIFGKLEWEKINITSVTPGTPFLATSNGKKYFLKQFQLPGYGTFKVRANTPIMVYSYGYSSEASYGYPAYAVLANLEKSLDTMAPVPTYTVECDGSVVNGLIEDYPQNINRSNLSVACYQNYSSYNYNFSYPPFITGEKDKTNWNLDVKDKSKDARAVITFGDRTGHDTTVVVNYYVKKPAFSQKIIDLGLIRFGNDTLGDFWLINQSTTAPLILNNIFLKYDDRGFELLDDNLNVLSFPLLLSPLDSVKIKVRFTGVQKGVYSDSIGISDECSTWMLGYVKAESGKPEISVSDFTFPDTYLQTKASGQVVIRNEGNYNLVITDYNPPGDPAFKFDIQEISASQPLIIGPGQFYTFDITFEPIQEKDYIDSTVFVSDATEIDPITILTGKGIIKTGVSDNDMNNSNLTIYPNPADGKLVVKFDKLSSAFKLRIYDVYGNSIEEKTVENGRTSIILDVSGLSNGVYFLLLNSMNGTVKSSINIVR